MQELNKASDDIHGKAGFWSQRDARPATGAGRGRQSCVPSQGSSVGLTSLICRAHRCCHRVKCLHLFEFAFVYGDRVSRVMMGDASNVQGCGREWLTKEKKTLFVELVYGHTAPNHKKDALQQKQGSASPPVGSYLSKAPDHQLLSLQLLAGPLFLYGAPGRAIKWWSVWSNMDAGDDGCRPATAPPLFITHGPICRQLMSTASKRGWPGHIYQIISIMDKPSICKRHRSRNSWILIHASVFYHPLKGRRGHPLNGAVTYGSLAHNSPNCFAYQVVPKNILCI